MSCVCDVYISCVVFVMSVLCIVVLVYVLCVV